MSVQISGSKGKEMVVMWVMVKVLVVIVMVTVMTVAAIVMILLLVVLLVVVVVVVVVVMIVTVMIGAPNIVRVVKSRMRCAGHLARMGEGRVVHWVLVGKPEGKRLLGRPRLRWGIILRWIFRKWEGWRLDGVGSG